MTECDEVCCGECGEDDERVLVRKKDGRRLCRNCSWLDKINSGTAKIEGQRNIEDEGVNIDG